MDGTNLNIVYDGNHIQYLGHTDKTVWNPEVRYKSLNTIVNKYGVDNAMKNKDICEKSIRTNRNNHGGKLFVQTKEFSNFMKEESNSHPDAQVGCTSTVCSTQSCKSDCNAGCGAASSCGGNWHKR